MLPGVARQDITGIVLAGGRGTRMGGKEKGLVPFLGRPLALHALERLQSQTAKGRLLLNANRETVHYERLCAPMGARVVPDGIPCHPGPLAGVLAGLQACETPWLLCVPCDVPLFPLDLAQRLANAAFRNGADIAVAAAPRTGLAASMAGQVIPQPVFCLVRAALQDNLASWLAGGGRKVGDWTSSHACAVAGFGPPADPVLAFANVNTAADLSALEADSSALVKSKP